MKTAPAILLREGLAEGQAETLVPAVGQKQIPAPFLLTGPAFGKKKDGKQEPETLTGQAMEVLDTTAKVLSIVRTLGSAAYYAAPYAKTLLNALAALA